MSKAKNNVLAYDRDNVFLSGLVYTLREMPEIQYVTGLSSCREVRRQIGGQVFDLFILEVNVMDDPGGDLIEEIRSKFSQARILVNTVCDADFLWDKLKHIRIDGLLHKAAATAEIYTAVRKMLQNSCYCTPAYAKLHPIFPMDPAHAVISDSAPTKRELEVLNSIALGDSSALTAEKLGVSENTVESFRKKLMQKFDARNAVDLIMKALKEGWITIE